MGCSRRRVPGRAVAAAMGGLPLSGRATGAGAGPAKPGGAHVTSAPPPAMPDPRPQALLLTSFTGPNDPTETVAVRKGNVTVVLCGAPALVDREIGTAAARLPPG